MSYFSPMQGNFAGISPMQVSGATSATPAKKPAKKSPVRKGASAKDIKKAQDAQAASAKAGIKIQQKKKTGTAKPTATDPIAKKSTAKKTPTTNPAAKKTAVKKGAAKTAPAVSELIPFGGSKKFKIKQLKNGQYRITGAKGNSLTINRELIIKKTKKGFSIIDKATKKRVSVKSILAKLKGNTSAGNAAEKAGKTAAKEGLFKKIGTAIKSHPKTAAAIAIATAALGIYATSKKDSEEKQINYNV